MNEKFLRDTETKNRTKKRLQKPSGLRKKIIEQKLKSNIRHEDRRKKARVGTVHLRRLSVFSVATNRKQNVNNYYVKLPKKAQIDLSDVNNRDPEMLYDKLIPFFRSIFSKIRKKRSSFITKLEYFNGENFTFVSTPLRDIEIVPGDFEQDILKLCHVIVAESEKYLNRASELLITGIEFQTYFKFIKKDKKHVRRKKTKPKTRPKRQAKRSK